MNGVSAIELSTLNGNNGFAIEGLFQGDNLGRSVGGAGDINGDGLSDLILGAPEASVVDTDASGRSFVLFGNRNSFPANFDLFSLNGSNGFSIEGAEVFSDAGFAVDVAGDANGDGFDDLIVGAPLADGNGFFSAGRSYVIFGGNSFSPSLDLLDFDPSDGFILEGASEDDKSGLSVRSAGDVNGDGLDDLIVGAPEADIGGSTNGASYVVFGSSTPSFQIDLSTLDGSNGFTLTGAGGLGQIGTSVSGGDINGDGFGDLIIGASGIPGSSLAIGTPGQTYVVFGSAGGFPATLDLSALNGSNGFTLLGINQGDRSGTSVTSADINGDGFDDAVIGAPGADLDVGRDAGEVYVFFGRASGFAATTDLATLDGSNGLTVTGAMGEANILDNNPGDRAGQSLGSGDFNGDGIEDIIIGAPGADADGNRDAGTSYILFGHRNSFPSRLSLGSLDGSNGVALKGVAADDESGSAVGNAGDINGDGADDAIVGAPEADRTTTGTGEVYIVLGASSGEPVPPPPNPSGGSAGDDRLDGDDADNRQDGLAGNDTLVGGGGNDEQNGNLGNDLIFGNEGNDSIEGGDGNDLIFAGRDVDTVRGGNGNDAIAGNIGNDEISGDAGRDVLFGNTQGDAIDGGADDDRLFGGADDDTLLGGLGNDILSGDRGNDRLTGGDGGDRFDFRLGDGSDTITDFQDGIDLIGLSAGLTFEGLNIDRVGQNTQISIEGWSVTLLGIDANLIDAADFAMV